MKERILQWWLEHKDAIIYEAESILKTFVSGVVLYASLNLQLIQDTGVAILTKPETVERTVVFGILAAAFRSGIKAVWAILKPQLLKFFSNN